MALQAKDIMNVDVVTARDTMPLRQLMILLRSNALSGLAVLDADENIVGVVSVIDVVGLDDPSGDDSVEKARFHTHVGTSALQHLDGLEHHDESDVLVGDIMSKSAITANVDTPVSELAGIMHDHHIHRVIIVDGGQVAGVVGTMDILKAVRDRKITG